MILGVIVFIGEYIEECHGIGIVGYPRCPGYLIISLGPGGQIYFGFLIGQFRLDTEVFLPHGLHGFGDSLVHFIGIE